jgi:segregation and condensation protein A
MKVVSDSFDMIVAGKLMLMAWKILRLQSESTRTRSEPPEEIFEEVDDGFFYEDEDMMVVPEVILTEAFQREPVRPVTMYELIDAFEEARAEIEIQQERERVRSQLKAKEPTKFDNKAHEEDDQRDVEEVWSRIQKLGTGQICIEDLYTADLKENLKTFVSILHLVRVGRLDVWQESLPYGEIYVEIMTEEASGTIEDNLGGRIEAVM